MSMKPVKAVNINPTWGRWLLPSPDTWMGSWAKPKQAAQKTWNDSSGKLKRFEKTIGKKFFEALWWINHVGHYFWPWSTSLRFYRALHYSRFKYFDLIIFWNSWRENSPIREFWGLTAKSREVFCKSSILLWLPPDCFPRLLTSSKNWVNWFFGHFSSNFSNFPCLLFPHTKRNFHSMGHQEKKWIRVWKAEKTETPGWINQRQFNPLGSFNWHTYALNKHFTISSNSGVALWITGSNGRGQRSSFEDVQMRDAIS